MLIMVNYSFSLEPKSRWEKLKYIFANMILYETDFLWPFFYRLSIIWLSCCKINFPTRYCLPFASMKPSAGCFLYTTRMILRSAVPPQIVSIFWIRNYKKMVLVSPKTRRIRQRLSGCIMRFWRRWSGKIFHVYLNTILDFKSL